MTSYQPSPVIPIGEKKFLCVEYPGIVKRTKRAIKTLGGEKMLARSLAQESQLHLWHRPEDPFSHPIHGDILKTTKLLAKTTRRIKRNKLTGEIVETGEEWKTEILGNITHVVRFRAMADLQHIVSKDNTVGVIKKALEHGNVETLLDYEIKADNNDNQGNLFNIPPPAFSVRYTPFDYGYRQNLPVMRVKVKQPDGTYKIGLINRDRRMALEITQVRYDVEKTPTKSWQLLTKPIDPLIIKTSEIIKELFEKRPIWSRFALKCSLDPIYHKHLSKALVHHAYTFINGPWKSTWVKYGVDPRSDQKYHKYQILKARMSSNLEPKQERFKGIRSAIHKRKEPTIEENIDYTNKHIFDGVSESPASSTYQMCDITDPQIQSLIYTKNYLKADCNMHSGFYYRCVYDRIRSFLRQKHIHLTKEGKPLHIPFAEDRMLDEVEREKAKIEEEKNGAAIAERAVIEAQTEMKEPGASKRLKQVADEYIEEFKQSTNNQSEYFDAADDSDLDMSDTLEDYDEDYDVFNDDEKNNDEENQVESMNIDEMIDTDADIN